MKKLISIFFSSFSSRKKLMEKLVQINMNLKNFDAVYSYKEI